MGTQVSKSTTSKKAAKKKAASKWLLYVLRCRDGSYYCGITNDMDRRLAQHNAGTGARYTRGRGPVELLRTWRHPDRSSASKAEFAFKALTRSEKEARIAVAEPRGRRRMKA
jgi:putative endonuclease